MTPLSRRKSRLTFQTSGEVRDGRKYRQIVVEAHPEYAVVRLAGLRTSYTVSFEAIYSLAVKQAVAAERAAKAAKKKAGGK